MIKKTEKVTGKKGTESKAQPGSRNRGRLAMGTMRILAGGRKVIFPLYEIVVWWN